MGSPLTLTLTGLRPASKGFVMFKEAVQVNPSGNQQAKSVPQQTINIEFKFEIKDIVIQINEETKRYFDSIKLRMSSIGTLVKIMSYDIDANVYLSSVTLEYDLLSDVDGSKLYLISSMGHQNPKQTRLIDIKLIKTDESSPTLEITHDNVLLNALVEFHSLSVVAHKMAIANMLKFVYALKQNLNYSQVAQVQPTGDLSSKSKQFPSLALFIDFYRCKVDSFNCANAAHKSIKPRRSSVQ
jgi:hypothetical protein